MNKVRQWKRLLQPYEQAVEELKVKFKAIRKEYRDMSEYSPIEFVTGRVKKISSIIEKSHRNGIDESLIEEQMEDIAGIRIMCQFQDDIYSVVNIIRNRDGKDLKIVYEKDYIRNEKTSGYKSYHMIIKYPVQTAYGEKEILAEIQIRTLAMNFWATIEHSLNYKYKQNMPERIKDRLKASAEAAAKLDLEMCEIRNEIIKAQLMFEEKSNVIRDIVDSIRVLHSSGEQEKALNFQEEFDEICNSGDQEALDNLLYEIKEVMPRYQLFKNNASEEA
ncbi:GTP pyrophosphokinase family protein [Acidaminobacter sp. JC074]|uniref:GTP pyrophosphokinase n=1 Tax=Acidaminobacter sp. JC074 TaxID=2530199 RepID=UPI001F115E0C|nr:GTP pyrophosphokinase family protein [Acidaminobacter sp. JC074]MCH4891103.1 GTP pyrophosphokinase family protein [Acidaminobacter sp. JC074]